MESELNAEPGTLSEWLSSCPAPYNLLSSVIMLNLTLYYFCTSTPRKTSAASLSPPLQTAIPQRVIAASQIIAASQTPPRKSEATARPPPSSSEQLCWARVSSILSIPLPELLSFRTQYRTLYKTTYQELHHTISIDPYLPCCEPNEEPESVLLGRFLRAMYNQNEKNKITSALTRMLEVVTYRGEYSTTDFFTNKNMARQLFTESSNPGTEMYFCDR